MTFTRLAINTSKTASAFAKPATLAFAAIVLAAACSGPSDKSAENTENTAEAKGALVGSNFEIDKLTNPPPNTSPLVANLIVDVNGNTDWVNAPNRQVGIDPFTGQNDNSYSGGSKEDDVNPGVGTGSIPGNKSDLTRFYVSNEQRLVNGVPNEFLYVAWERANTLGTANMDFEFNQSRTAGGNGVTPIRTANDLLVTFDFANGGNNVNLGLLRWITSANGTASDCFTSNTLPCWGKRVDLSGSGFADGSVNAEITVTDPIPTPPITLAPGRFGEAAINLTASGALPPNECRDFGSVHLNSRSSDAFTSTLKDLIAPINVNINNCAPATIQLKKVDPAGNPLGGATMQLFLDDGDGVLDAGDTQQNGNCVTALPDGIGTCTFSVTQNGTYIGHELTAPNGYSPAPDQFQTVVLSNQPQTFTLTFTDSPVPGRINVAKRDDKGNPINGAVFTLFVDAPPIGGAPGVGGVPDSQVVGTCTTGLPAGTPAGTCSFLNVALGEYWVVETTVPPGYFPPDQSVPVQNNYQHVTIGLGANPGEGQTVNLSFTNDRKFHKLVIVCESAGNTLYPSDVTFEGQTKMSISSGQLPPTINQMDLCNLAGARFEDNHSGTISQNITIQITP